MGVTTDQEFDGLRTPPQDVEAEESVLGAMLLSKDAIADCVESMSGDDFYRPAHETIYEAILDLYSRGEPADSVTVANYLTKTGDLSRIGGPAYLHTLIASVPTAANAAYYATIVRERAVLRRLVEAGTRIVQMGYDAEGDTDDVVNNAQAEIYRVTEKHTTEDYVILSEILGEVAQEIERNGDTDGQTAGVPTGFTEFDQLTNGLHPGQMIVIAARPGVGKSTLALDFIRSAAIHHKQAAVFFSPRDGQERARHAPALGRIGDPPQSLRRGELSPHDWTNLAATEARINDAPLFVDDSPNMALTEIRAKCRRLKRRSTTSRWSASTTSSS